MAPESTAMPGVLWRKATQQLPGARRRRAGLLQMPLGDMLAACNLQHWQQEPATAIGLQFKQQFLPEKSWQPEVPANLLKEHVPRSGTANAYL